MITQMTTRLSSLHDSQTILSREIDQITMNLNNYNAENNGDGNDVALAMRRVQSLMITLKRMQKTMGQVNARLEDVKIRLSTSCNPDE